MVTAISQVSRRRGGWLKVHGRTPGVARPLEGVDAQHRVRDGDHRKQLPIQRVNEGPVQEHAIDATDVAAVRAPLQALGNRGNGYSA